MTQVDFYLLTQTSPEQRNIFACRLAEKFYRLGHQVYLHTENPQQAAEINQLLWTFNPSSFVPHPPTDDAVAVNEERVIVGHQTPPGHFKQWMINLGDSVPEFFSRFDRVSEIIVQDDSITTKGRINYRFYNNRGYPLNTHKIK